MIPESWPCSEGPIESCPTYTDLIHSYPFERRTPTPIAELSRCLEVPSDVREAAARIYEILRTEGRGGYLLAAASLILSGRRMYYLITTNEVAAALRTIGVEVPKRKIAVWAARYGKTLGIWRIPSLDEYVLNVVRNLGKDRELGEKIEVLFPGRDRWCVLERVKMRALRMCGDPALRRLPPGKSPLITAAAVVAISTASLGVREPSQSSIAKAVGVNESVLRRRVSELLSLGVGLG